MTMAYKEAEKAYEEGDVPIGCVIVSDEAKSLPSHIIEEIKMAIPQAMQRYLLYSKPVRN